ncbi:type III secretion system export apparatus subunit SctV [Terasakiella pusilla]|uniref:type III secretion system export apparatus subunit SctV n=1 Tax=Terasakiella pusilla TaxID=64973 RepID=UPI003AA9681B
MDKILGLLVLMSKRTDIALAVLLMAIIFMMILPMPTLVVDTLIATNMTLSVILLMVAVYLPSPLGFTSFPAVLLITTLFRLALSITTTRLILLQADAGAIVETFGNFVVQGNLIVGLVIFLIITIVQFIVITKGSERVAEVGARFSLDAMPGKQMSIDGDMRAGTIDMKEAKRRRSMVEKESQLYGAMDGAMKFVKGDAIAGLIIIFVNILGGVSIGAMQRGMEISDALQVYSILTIGDGLVSQIPALLISITAGIIVTRISDDDVENANLGSDITGQVFGHHRALLVASAILVGFGFIPGFPTTIFLILAALVGGGGVMLNKFQSGKFGKKEGEDDEEGGLAIVAEEDYNENLDSKVSAAELTLTTPLIIDVSSDGRSSINDKKLNNELIRLRRALYFDLGVPFPEIYLRFNQNLAPGSYTILINEVPTCQGKILAGKLLSREKVDDLAMLNIEVEKGEKFLPNLETLWVDAKHKDRMDAMGYSYMEGATILTYHLSYVLKQHAEEFIGIQETKRLIDTFESEYGELIKEAQRVLPIQKINEILKRLVSEDVSIRNLRTIFEALIEWGQKEKDTVLLVEYVRGSLSRHICHKYKTSQNILPSYMFTPDVEDTIRNEIRQTSTGSYLALDPAAVRKLVTNLKETVGDLSAQPHQPVLLTSMDIRRYVRKMIEAELYELPVLSYQELAKDVNIQPLGRVTL